MLDSSPTSRAMLLYRRLGLPWTGVRDLSKVLNAEASSAAAATAIPSQLPANLGGQPLQQQRLSGSNSPRAGVGGDLDLLESPPSVVKGNAFRFQFRG